VHSPKSKDLAWTERTVCRKGRFNLRKYFDETRESKDMAEKTVNRLLSKSHRTLTLYRRNTIRSFPARSFDYGEYACAQDFHSQR